ncbi:MFS transporter [Sphingomonas sanxanigenens]|uniref:MFS transporter n=1 Tax=Sphingomonas sanxanigenens TaxID=397260 RepID=UPI00130174EA|nr:MFS transporter [Sphingomonas sanxanigenens]
MQPRRLAIPRVSRIEWAYGQAHFGKSLLWHSSQLLFAYFLTEACGFSPYLMGIVLASALLVNAVTDLVVGRALARHVAGFAAASRAQFGGAAASVSGLMLFACAARLEGPSQVALAAGGLGLFALAYSLLDVPQNAILSLAPLDDRRRMRLSAARLVLSGVAQLLVVSAFALLMRGLPATHAGNGFLGLSMAIGLIVIGSAGLLARVAAHPLPAGEDRADAAATDTGMPEWRGFALLLGMMAAYTVTTGVVGKLEPYVAAYWFSAATDGAAFMMAIAIGSMVAQPLWTARARHRSADGVLAEAALVLALGGAAFQITGFGIVTALVAGLVLGAGQGGISMLLWTRLATIAHRHRGQATRLFGAFTFTSKTAGAVATLVLGQILHVSRFAEASDRAGVLVPVMTWLPACGAAGLLLFLFARRASRHSLTGETPCLSPSPR